MVTATTVGVTSGPPRSWSRSRGGRRVVARRVGRRGAGRQQEGTGERRGGGKKLTHANDSTLWRMRGARRFGVRAVGSGGIPRLAGRACAQRHNRARRRVTPRRGRPSPHVARRDQAERLRGLGEREPGRDLRPEPPVLSEREHLVEGTLRVDLVGDPAAREASVPTTVTALGGSSPSAGERCSPSSATVAATVSSVPTRSTTTLTLSRPSGSARTASTSPGPYATGVAPRSRT